MCCMQAWDNFAHEYRELRRSFRDDEYSAIAAVNPPRGPLSQVYRGCQCGVRPWKSGGCHVTVHDKYGKCQVVPWDVCML